MFMIMARFLPAALTFLVLAVSTEAAETGDVGALANRIDQFIEKRCKEEKSPLAGPSSDTEFLRRAYLDLTGRIPVAAEVYRFLADRRSDKRALLVEELLASPRYVENQTNLWRELLLPRDNNPQVEVYREQLEAWLRQQFRANAPIDRMVRELLTTPVTSGTSPAEELASEGARVSPSAFFRSNQMRPENLAAATSRLFLGVRLECAQCHNHPFDRWSRTQFWELAAFYGGLQVQRDNGGRMLSVREVSGRPSLRIPETSKEVSARFLDGKEPDWSRVPSGRTALADWATSGDNPYFARNAANRLWSQLFGIGLVEPADDFSENNPASHPELLDELARQLVAHNFDQKFILRAILASKTWQRSSIAPDGVRTSPRLFARMPVRGLRPEQLFDSLVQATGQPQVADRPAVRADFLRRFTASHGNRVEQQTSILEVLLLMNGALIGDATTLTRGGVFTGIAEAPWLDTPGRVQALYVATLSRLPTAEERRKLTAYIDGGDPRKALADVFWALLNSSEFLFNH
jgi:hypothetical protein